MDKVNLAYILEDAEKIYIPSINDKGENIEFIVQNSENREGAVENKKAANSSKKKDTNKDKNENTVNINTATQTELEAIPGIGPSTALKIIDYRKENGNYKKIEDVQNVKGIGESKYKEMKDYIRVK